MLIFGYSFTSNAAVVYTDITDETLASGGSVTIDFDADGTPEFTIDDMGFGGPAEPGIMFASADHHFVTVSTDEWDVILGLTENTAIDANSGWFDYGDAYINPFWGTTLFPTGTDVFLGAQFPINGNAHYGWIRVNWDGNGTLIFKDFAYNDSPGAAIAAGEMGSTSVLVNSITLIGQGGTFAIDIPAGTLQMIASILPADATDMSVTWSVTNMSGEAQIDNTGLLTAIADGTVEVKAIANDGSGTEGATTITISNQTFGIETDRESQIEIFPNPASDQINVCNTSSYGISDIAIFSMDGKRVSLFNNMDSNTIQLDISNWPKGIYFAKLMFANSETQTTKIVKR